MSKTEEYLIEAADQCVAMARTGRDMAAKLEAMSNTLMAKAVELDTLRQRNDERRDAQQPIRKASRK
jgi:hypothetical protein